MASPSLKRPPVFREDGTIEIRLTRGYVAVIDAQDAELAKLNWHALVTECGLVYAKRDHGVLLHREILGLEKGHEVEGDHQDGDTLNCRRSNLRPVAPTRNRRNKVEAATNRSGHVGVFYDKNRKTWRAQIDRKHLGCFATLEEAVDARLSAELQDWGVEPRRAAAHQ